MNAAAGRVGTRVDTEATRQHTDGMSGPPRVLATIGDETATVEDFVAILAEGIRRLLDVRGIAVSRRTGFAKRSLSAALAHAGINSEVRWSGSGDVIMGACRSGLGVAALVTSTVCCACFPSKAVAQPSMVGEQVAGLPLTVTQVRWERPPTPTARLAKQVVARQMNLPIDQVPGVQAALYDLDGGQQLLLVQGGGYSGASTTGVGIFLGDARGFREAGAVGGSRSDSVPVTLVPGRGGYPGLRVGMTQASPYNPKLSMAEQRYRVISHMLRYEPATGRYVDAGARAR